MNKTTIFLNTCDDKNAVCTVNLDEVLSIFVRVVTGDEQVFVTFKDGTVRYYDPYESMRSDNHFEGEYYVYLPSKGINIIDEFNNEESSHGILYGPNED